LQKGEEEEKSKLHAISMNLDSTAGFGRFLDLASKFNFIYVVVWHLLWEVYKATFTIPDLEFYNSYLYHFTGLVPVLCVFAVCFIFERIDIENKYTKLLSKIWVIVQFVPFNPDAVSSPVKASPFRALCMHRKLTSVQAHSRAPYRHEIRATGEQISFFGGMGILRSDTIPRIRNGPNILFAGARKDDASPGSTDCRNKSY
jgi:hypothetical protein